MKLAWFHPGPDAALDASDAVDLAAELGSRHLIDRFDAPRAHDFVWRHFREPYDLVVFELGDSPAYEYIWAYLFHYPGILILRGASLERGRTEALRRTRRLRDLRAERRFSGLTLLRAPLCASRLVVVHDAAFAAELRERVPGLAVEVLPVGVAARPVRSGSRARLVVTGGRDDVAARAAARARQAGMDVPVTTQANELQDDDVVVALEWPPTGAPPPAALRAMASGIPAIVLETPAVAHWPVLDPQTWRARGYITTDAPIAISIDPRDEEHSLMLAIRRLAADPGLRRQLGASAARWAAQHASLTVAAAAWESALREAAARVPTHACDPLPAHLTEDGTRRARTLLAEIGAEVDFLDGDRP